jgi:hypothetical protein
MCETCVFRPGNLMRLQPGRLRGMVSDALRDDTAIICHETLEAWDGEGDAEAICRGFFDRHADASFPIRLAVWLKRIRYLRPKRRA